MRVGRGPRTAGKDTETHVAQGTHKTRGPFPAHPGGRDAEQQRPDPRPLSTAEGLPKGRLPGPVGEAFLEGACDVTPLRGKGSGQGCSPASLEDSVDDGPGALAGAPSTCNLKAWATGEGTGACGWGIGFCRAGGGAGLKAALMRGVVARSHWQRWHWLRPSSASGQPAMGIKVAVNSAATGPHASLVGQTWGSDPRTQQCPQAQPCLPLRTLPPGAIHRPLQVREEGVSGSGRAGGENGGDGADSRGSLKPRKAQKQQSWGLCVQRNEHFWGSCDSHWPRCCPAGLCSRPTCIQHLSPPCLPGPGGALTGILMLSEVWGPVGSGTSLHLTKPGLLLVKFPLIFVQQQAFSAKLRT